MGRAQKRKGYRGEYELVKKLKNAGVDAKRVPLSGQTEFEKADVIVEGLRAEVKVRKQGFSLLYRYLADKDLLFVKSDRKPYLVVMTLEKFIDLVKGVK